MNQKMKAAVVVQFGKPLELQEWDIPTPGPGQILVKTEACGVCHTDVHAWHGDWPLKPKPPFIPGHEGIGPVVAVGAGVTVVKVGDRVGVPWLYSACGHCEHCLSAWETVCGEAEFGGYTKNGGFAEYMLADPNYVAHIPTGLSSTEAGPIICAGVTTYKGIKETARNPVNGLPSPESAALGIWRSNTPRSWDFTSARSTWMTASSPTPKSSGPISPSMPRSATRSLR